MAVVTEEAMVVAVVSVVATEEVVMVEVGEVVSS